MRRRNRGVGRAFGFELTPFGKLIESIVKNYGVKIVYAGLMCNPKKL